MFEKNINWYEASTWAKVRKNICEQTLSWLEYEGSMTDRLKVFCKAPIEVKVLKEGETLFSDLGDCKSFFSPDKKYWLREVCMSSASVPVLEAKCITAMEKNIQRIIELGNTPLGQYLFKEKALKRKIIQIGKIDDLWCRRSCFYVDDNPLILTEVFLKTIPMYL